MSVCADCERAEREYWPVYNVSLWCCRARHIVDASVACARDEMTLEDVQRKRAHDERRANPGEWSLVRERLAVLKGRK